MILDLDQFQKREKRYWQELEGYLDRIENSNRHKFSLEEVNRFHYLYERASSDLAEIQSFSHEREVREYLERLVSRAYREIFDTRTRLRFNALRWFFTTFPRTFRKHVKCFWLSLAVTLIGCLFGAGALSLDPESKATVLPFGHLAGKPSYRVKMEEERMSADDPLKDRKSSFSTFLMTHNTKVSIQAMAFGLTWGIGTLIVLFYNGVILGAVSIDYILDGQLEFLIGWLLPHGSIEIPAILLAGQCGIMLAVAMIGRRSSLSMKRRLQNILPDVAHIICGVAIMLVWAGIVEAFFSQYHEPVLPYHIKISVGATELLLLVVFLGFCGRTRPS